MMDEEDEMARDNIKSDMEGGLEPAARAFRAAIETALNALSIQELGT